VGAQSVDGQYGSASRVPVLSTAEHASQPPTARSGRARWKAYLGLTKPKIIRLLLITTVPTMFLAAHGFPSAWRVLATLVGGSLAAGSANAINCWADRDIDVVMHRTAHRPLARNEVEPGHALRFGIVLGVLSALLLSVTVNLLSAGLAVCAILFYVFVYTLGLKRRTSQNIVIGGAAGAFPVLIGWSAVTGTLGLPAWILFAIVFAWTPPHFWALAMRYREDYARAGVPMLPVVASVHETTLQILFYAVAMLCLTMMLGPVAGLGLIYFVAAAVLGVWFVGAAWRLHREPGEARAMGVFHTSITYLGLLFLAIAVDAVVG
jgi:heme o synthase